MYKNAVRALGICAILLFVVAIVGMSASGSHRWVEPAEEAGWILFVSLIIIEYLVAARTEDDGGYVKAAKLAWAFGIASLLLLLVALIGNVASVATPKWTEPVEVAGLLCMLGLVLLAVAGRRKARDGD